MTNEREIAKLLAADFIERRDAKAIQTPDGGYQPHRAGPQSRYEDRPLVPFDLASLMDHIEGKQTYGHFMVKPVTDTSRCFVLDIDFNKASRYIDPETGVVAEINPREVWADRTTQCKKDLAIQLSTLANGLACVAHRLLGCKVIVSYSGNKGMHVIGCFDPGTSAAACRAAGQTVLDACQCFTPLRGNNFWKHSTGFPSLEIEVFPKQDEVKPDGFGNLVRLPLGINRKSGKPGFFLRVDVELGIFIKDDPLLVLEKGSVR